MQVQPVRIPDALARRLDKRHSDREVQREVHRQQQQQQKRNALPSGLGADPAAAAAAARAVAAGEIGNDAVASAAYRAAYEEAVAELQAEDGRPAKPGSDGVTASPPLSERDAAKLAALRGWIAGDGARLAAARYASAASAAAAEGLPGLPLPLGRPPHGSPVRTPPRRERRADSERASPAGDAALTDAPTPDAPLPLGQTVLLPGATLRLGRSEDGADADAADADDWADADADADAAEREAVAYSELLETLKELVDTPAPKPKGGTGAAGRRGGAEPLAPSGCAPGVSSAADEDLLAAGLMSGVGDAAPSELAMMASAEEQDGGLSAAQLSSLLRRELGVAVFEKAHARLQTVVEEEDDDALVADIQSILGPKRLDKLPMILKLIFLEGGGTLG